MSIFLIRHGETEGNAARIVQRSPSAAPSRPSGWPVASRARASCRSCRAISRAVTTATRLHDVTRVPLAFDPLLQERNFGDVRGTPYADLGVDLFAPDYAPPNGETWPAFHARVDRAWARIQELAAAARGHLAVVTHGLVCRSLAERHLVLPDGEAVPLRWENTSLTIVDGRAPWRVRLLNCIAHLDDLDVLPLRGSGVV